MPAVNGHLQDMLEQAACDSQLIWQPHDLLQLTSNLNYTIPSDPQEVGGPRIPSSLTSCSSDAALTAPIIGQNHPCYGSQLHLGTGIVG
jgi:hypothetical protein